jgi:hypothetical protein
MVVTLYLPSIPKTSRTIDYLGHRFSYDARRGIVYWTRLQWPVVGWGFTIREN